MFCKKGVLRNIAKFTEKHKNEKKETGTLVSCKFCKIYKKSFSYRLPPVAASVHVIPHSLSISHILSWLLKGYLPFHFPVENIIKWTLKTYIYLIYTGTGTYTWHIFHFPVNSHFPQYINKNDQHKIDWHNGTPHVCVFFFTEQTHPI